MKKITYNGKECKNSVYFVLFSDELDSGQITSSLKIEPTSTKSKKGIEISWIYKIEIGDDVDLETPLQRIVNLFQDKVVLINQLKQDLKLSSRLQFVIDIDINPESSTPFFPFDNRVIDFLFNTNTVVDFDLYKTDTMNIIDKDFIF